MPKVEIARDVFVEPEMWMDVIGQHIHIVHHDRRWWLDAHGTLQPINRFIAYGVLRGAGRLDDEAERRLFGDVMPKEKRDV